MYKEFPRFKIFPLHGHSFWDCLCILAHTFGIGLLLLMVTQPPDGTYSCSFLMSECKQISWSSRWKKSTLCKELGAMCYVMYCMMYAYCFGLCDVCCVLCSLCFLVSEVCGLLSSVCCVISDVWYVLCDVWYMMCDVWCVMCDMWYVICDMWCVIYDVSCAMCDVCCMMCDVRHVLSQLFQEHLWLCHCSPDLYNSKRLCQI